MGPLEMFYSWQAMLVAGIAWMITQFVKTAIDIHTGHGVIQKQTSVPPPDPEIVPGPETKDDKAVTYRDPAKPATVQVKAAVGRDVRRDTPIMNRIVLPIVPVLVGALIAAIVPVHPEVLTAYVDSKVQGVWQGAGIYAMWGAICGQFSSYIFDKISKGIEGFRVPTRQAEGG